MGLVNESNSHNEHIKPRDSYPKLSLDYNNLLVSCTDDNHCGKYKDNHFDEANFLSPLDEDCEEQFYYHEDGEILGKTEKARKTIDMLGLNSKSLKDSRRTLYQQCSLYEDKEIIKAIFLDEQDGKYSRYIGMIRYFFENDLF